MATRRSTGWGGLAKDAEAADRGRHNETGEFLFAHDNGPTDEAGPLNDD
jgi:hypothetical protein